MEENESLKSQLSILSNELALAQSFDYSSLKSPSVFSSPQFASSSLDHDMSDNESISSIATASSIPLPTNKRRSIRNTSSTSTIFGNTSTFTPEAGKYDEYERVIKKLKAELKESLMTSQVFFLAITN